MEKGFWVAVVLLILVFCGGIMTCHDNRVKKEMLEEGYTIEEIDEYLQAGNAIKFNNEDK